MKEIEEEEKAQVIRLGDASVASPFTSKLSTVMSGTCAGEGGKRVSHCVVCIMCNKKSIQTSPVV